MSDQPNNDSTTITGQPGFTESDGWLRGYSAPDLEALADQTLLCHEYPRTCRKGADGRVYECVEFKCLRCKRGLLLSRAEAIPPPGQPVPLCAHCLQAGVRSVLRQRGFGSGPIDLHV